MSSSYQPSHQHSISHSSSSSLLPANAPSPFANAANQTRILLLSDFDPALKTRDLMDLLSEWEDDRGGFKVKWRDDTSAWIVFSDAHVGMYRRDRTRLGITRAVADNADYSAIG